MKPALEKFLLIAATLAAIGLFVFVAMWSSIKEKKTQMDDLFNNTNVPTSFYYEKEMMDSLIALSSFASASIDSQSEINSSPLLPHNLAV
ncbi:MULTISPECIES: hypothetical protein [unclassified Paenibacillus]|uniref:hypothetical protein n=1 Tax=unclassified Paenibacillus TaxID=185978 RepID=UPI0036349848